MQSELKKIKESKIYQICAKQKGETLKIRTFPPSLLYPIFNSFTHLHRQNLFLLHGYQHLLNNP